MGQGRGGGRGMGQGMGMQPPPGPIEPPADTEKNKPKNLDQEIDMLKTQADVIMAQVQAITTRISKLQGKKEATLAEVVDAKADKASGDTAVNKTAVIVDQERCDGCCICADMCPEAAISVQQTAMIDLLKCTGCGLCIDECPNEAICLPS